MAPHAVETSVGNCISKHVEAANT